MFMTFINQYKTIIIITIALIVLISTIAFIKKNMLLLILCICIFGAGSTYLVKAYNVMKNSANEMTQITKDIVTENNLYDDERAKDLINNGKEKIGSFLNNNTNDE